MQARGLRAFMRGEIGQYAEDTAKALNLWQKLNVPEQVAGCLENLGEAARESGQYDRALDYCQQALAKWSGLGERVEEAYTHCLLGGVLVRGSSSLHCLPRSLTAGAERKRAFQDGEILSKRS